MTKTLAPIGAVLLVLALPAAAGATIVPQRGIAGASLDMTRAQLQSKLGDPDRKQTRTSSIFGKYDTWYYGQTSIDLFHAGAGKVFDMSTTSRSQKTVSGVGVGSTVAQVKKGVSGVRCDAQHCYLGRFNPGRKVTDFILSKTGRVARVTVGYVLD